MISKKSISFWKLSIIVLSISLLFSCTSNEIDKLLNEMDTFINKKNHEELFKQLVSDDASLNIKAMAEITRFEIVIGELERQRKDMSVKQLEKYLLIMIDAAKIIEEMQTNMTDLNNINRGGVAQTVVVPSSPYVGTMPQYSFYTNIGMIRTNTKDSVPNMVIVDMILGYDLNDNSALTEINGRLYELRDFVRTFFRSKTALELKPENEDRLKQEIIEVLNTRLFSTTRIKMIIFNQLDVMEM